MGGMAVTGLPSWSVGKNLPAMQKMQATWVRSLGGDDALEEGMATHSSILAERVLWAEECCGLWSRGLPRVRHNGERLSTSAWMVLWS